MRLLVVSPHFDDAPLSLGQSMLDGSLVRHDVTVGVVFGRSGWVRWFHPTPRRRPVASAIRRIEETVNARRFGYRLVVGDRDEALLRLNTTDPAEYLLPDYEPSGSPELDSVIRLIGRWSTGQDAVLVPVGIGEHIDHQLVAAAGVRLADAGTPVGFYADRPYASMLSDDDQVARAAELEAELIRTTVSGSITREKLRRLWYPSQFDEQFVDALVQDQQTGRPEVVFATDQLVALGAL